MKESEAHQYFSAHCFNEVWTHLENETRSKEDTLLMRDAAHASLYHWKKREDCQPSNLSIGLWMLARIYAVLEKGDEAMEYASACIEISESKQLGAFCLGYAYEAAARAAAVQGDHQASSDFLEKARQQVEQVEDEGDRALLAADIVDLER